MSFIFGLFSDRIQLSVHSLYHSLTLLWLFYLFVTLQIEIQYFVAYFFIFGIFSYFFLSQWLFDMFLCLSIFIFIALYQQFIFTVAICLQLFFYRARIQTK